MGYRRRKKATSSGPSPLKLRQRCSCGKFGYATRGYARRIVRYMRAQGDSQDLGTYECLSGNGLWHVGHDRLSLDKPNLNDPRNWMD